MINISKSENGVELRVLSEHKPAESNVANIIPTLEDYYLYVFGLQGSKPKQKGVIL